MPSQDDFKERRDENLALTAPEKPRETAKRGPEREMNGQVLRLARRMGIDPDDLASRLPLDTLRRLKWPALETVNENGTRTFKHDPGIIEGRKAETRP